MTHIAAGWTPMLGAGEMPHRYAVEDRQARWARELAAASKKLVAPSVEQIALEKD